MTMSAKLNAKPRETRPTVAHRCRSLIIDGLNDAEVWQQIRREFKLPKEKEFYPRWYRAQLHRFHG
jgi:hypothetical protein